MATINVRQLGEEVVHRLKRRAAKNRRSLEGEVRQILESAVEDDMSAKRAAFLVWSDRMRKRTKGSYQTPSEILIREDREHGHRDD